MANDADMLPEDSSDGVAFDASELRVNFSDAEASSEAREFTPIPAGKYNCAITDVTVKQCGPKSKNPGKPFWAIECTIQDGKYNGRKVFTNVMLFDGALYTAAQLFKALGGEWANALTTGVIPHGDKLMGQKVTCVVKKIKDQYKIDQGEWDSNSGDPKPMKNEIGGFMPAGQGSLATASGGQAAGSLLP